MSAAWKPRRGAALKSSKAGVVVGMVLATIATVLAAALLHRNGFPDVTAWSVGAGMGLAILVSGAVWDRRRKSEHARRAALWMKRKQTLDSLCSLDWQAFEELVAAAYRKQGWNAQVVGGGGADGGVDVWLKRGPRQRLVQCKHWKNRVGIKPVREMVGLIQHHRAERGLIVASGGFAKECWAFVQGKQIDLIDGPRLLALLDQDPEQARQRPF